MRIQEFRPAKVITYTLIAAVVVVALFLLAVNAVNHSVVINNITVPPVPVLDPASVALGEGLYALHCASCHGQNLEGVPDWKSPLADGSFLPPPHDSNGHTWHHSDALILKTVANGGDPANKPLMPAFKDRLSQTEMVAILDFIKSRWDQKTREFQWWITQTNNGQ